MKFISHTGGVNRLGVRLVTLPSLLAYRVRGSLLEGVYRVTNDIITEAIEYGCSTIVVEDLTNIRENIPRARWQHHWAFRQLFSYVEYKAEAVGIAVETVPPENTSKRCSRIGCGFTVDENRRSRGHFRCQKCNHEANADYNAVAG